MVKAGLNLSQMVLAGHVVDEASNEIGGNAMSKADNLVLFTAIIAQGSSDCTGGNSGACNDGAGVRSLHFFVVDLIDYNTSKFGPF